MSRNALPVSGHKSSSPGIDRILLRDLHSPAPPSAGTPKTAFDEAYWREHPEEFMRGLLAATRETFAAK